MKYFLPIFIACVALTACNDDPLPAVKATGIHFESKSLELLQEDSVQLAIAGSPSGASMPDLLWVSLNPAVVSVSSGGTVKGLVPGTAKVVAKTVLYPQLTDTCVVTVKSGIEAVQFDSLEVHVPEADSIVLKVKHLPSSKSTPAYEWTTLNPTVAKVDQTGKVTAFQTGSAAIVVTVKTDRSKSDTCMVRVLTVGTQGSPYLIYTVTDLQKVRDRINTYTDSWGKKYYKLMADLDFNGSPVWTPISSTEAISFKGVFDGNGKTIRNISFNRAYQYAGLFGVVNGGEIKNLRIEWTLLASDKFSAGGIAGHLQNKTKITNCTTAGNITGKSYAGGIAGIAEASTIVNCSASGNISAYEAAGGIAGYSTSLINSCASSGNVSSSGKYAGGVVGTGGTINDCNSTGNVTVVSTMNTAGEVVSAGGIVGYGAYVLNSFSHGKIEAKGIVSTSAGGVGGYGNYIVNCYATGDVSANSKAVAYAGGVLGTSGFVMNCYARGSVLSVSETSKSYAGGIEGSGRCLANTIAFGSKVMSVAGQVDNCSAQRIAFYSFSPSLSCLNDENFVSASLEVYKGTSTENPERISQFNTVDNDGRILSSDPVSVLNYTSNLDTKWDDDYTRGLKLKKWVTKAGENNGYPMLE